MMALILTMLISPVKAEKLDKDVEAIMQLAKDYRPERSIAVTVAQAAQTYKVDFRYLVAIAIAESSFNSNTKIKFNKNGTFDIGMFQINSINFKKCKEFNLYKEEGSIFCAAKLLSEIQKNRPFDFYGVYHSKTQSKKTAYMKKIEKILNKDRELVSLNEYGKTN